MLPPVASSPTHQRPYAAWTDQALVRALRTADELAFAEIYERYWYQLFLTAYRKLGSREGAEELVQELFADLWHKRGTSQIQHLRSYLYSAVKYLIIDVFRSRTTHVGYLTRQQQAPQPLIDRSTEEGLAAEELSRALAASVATLPESTRQVFRLSRFEHQSVPEIAVQLKLSPKTVEYHLTRALKLLRVRLKDFLIMVALLACFGK